ncbi:MAG: large conductance mechanosensitive channel protein MscL [Clostridiales bacterium]|nr:large conductance mechanosensitive channel protein MscL [Clostridiales bacterium]
MKKERKKLSAEFKEFVMRGNVIDLAVGVIIGGAFQAIVNSLVNDVIMPIISLLTGGIDFSSWQAVLGEGENAATLNYGNFISAVLNFLIMAAVIFAFIKLINGITNKVKKPEKPAEPEKPTTKVCPYCKSEIALEATRCPHCTSEVE